MCVDRRCRRDRAAAAGPSRLGGGEGLLPRRRRTEQRRRAARESLVERLLARAVTLAPAPARPAVVVPRRDDRRPKKGRNNGGAAVEGCGGHSPLAASPARTQPVAQQLVPLPRLREIARHQRARKVARALHEGCRAVLKRRAHVLPEALWVAVARRELAGALARLGGAAGEAAEGLAWRPQEAVVRISV